MNEVQLQVGAVTIKAIRSTVEGLLLIPSQAVEGFGELHDLPAPPSSPLCPQTQTEHETRSPATQRWKRRIRPRPQQPHPQLSPPPLPSLTTPGPATTPTGPAAPRTIKAKRKCPRPPVAAPLAGPPSHPANPTTAPANKTPPLLEPARALTRPLIPIPEPALQVRPHLTAPVPTHFPPWPHQQGHPQRPR